jgi:hypothetical protein
LISEIRSLSADCLPSLLGASACGVLASQFFGRSVANFFNPMRITVKKKKEGGSLFDPLHCLGPMTQFIDLPALYSAVHHKYSAFSTFTLLFGIRTPLGGVLFCFQ